MKNNIGYETLKIIKTNPSSQISEKKNFLNVYEYVASVFAPLLKSNDKQSRLETQKSDDEQLDTRDMSDLKSEESAAISKRIKKFNTESNA